MGERSLLDGQFLSQKQTIERIATEYSSTKIRVARGYHSMLEKLGVEIYSKAAHFALELIQNADDAKYTGLRHPSVPYLAFEAHENLIHVESNEDGFTTEDVEALCDIDQSTKNATNAIGKKGIGFKSVFKVCDLVQIGSNGFQFSFDKTDRPFGMVKPKWHPLSNWLEDQAKTHMCLQLSAGQSFPDIQDDINELEPSVLLFLRNIQEISIHTDFLGLRTLMTCKDRGKQITTITTQRWLGDLKLDSQLVEYVMVHYKPSFSAAPEVILAFPRSVKGDLGPQQVHNFLPIRSYGFKFILQADFQLTSNREAIDESSRRNCTIRDIVPAAFLSAVQLLNKSKDDCLTWLQYLPGPSTLQDFFASVDINGHLSNKNILFSHSGRLMKPSDLIYVPSKFRFSKHKPVPLIFDGRHALSTRYHECDSMALKRLGIAQLDVKVFVGALIHLATTGWPEINWHENLARILLKINPDFLADIPLIPVDARKGIIWVRPKSLKSSPVYFRENLGDHRIPDGVDFRFVPVSASGNEHRYMLFEKLHVTPLSVAAICEGVGQALANKCGSYSVDIAISQTKFLFQHRDTFSTKDIRFWTVVDGKAKANLFRRHKKHWVKARKVYINDPQQGPHMISRLLSEMDYFYCLDPDYLQHDLNIVMHDWMNWLIDQGISATPRAVTANDYTEPSAAFKCFAEHASEESLCKVLLTHWDHYRPFLPVIADPLEKRLGRRVLPTKLLCSTARDLQVPSSWSRFLDVTDVDRDVTKYHLLNHFGLITQATIPFYAEILRFHKRGSLSQPQRQLIHNIYRLLQGCSDDAPIRADFRKQKLIAVDVQGTGRCFRKWLSPDECFWTDLSCLRFNSGLSTQYGDCEQLFRKMLTISDVATTEHITTDLASFASSGNLEFIVNNVKPILFRLSVLLQRAKEDCRSSWQPNTYATKEKVKTLKIWPIIKSQANNLEVVSSQEFSSDKSLFVPDRPDLYELFRGRVPLLDFRPDEVSKIQPLIEWFPGARLLSQEVQKKLSYSAKQTLLQMMTSDYRQKHEGILRCVRHYLPSLQAEVGGQLHQKLQNIAVFEVEKVDCVQWVQKKPPETGSGTNFNGTLGSVGDALASVKTLGDVVLQQDHERFAIYMAVSNSVRRKANCYSIPQSLVAEIGLPAEAISVIAPVIELGPSLSSSILDERGIARLPGALYVSSWRESDTIRSRTADTSDAEPRLGSPAIDTISSRSSSISPVSTPPEVSRKSKNAAKESLFSQNLVFRFCNSTGPSSDLLGVPTRQDQSWETSPRSHSSPSQAQKVRATGSLHPSRNPQTPTQAEDDRPVSTERLPNNLTGSTELQNAIIQRGTAMGLSQDDIACVQNKDNLPLLTKMPDEPLLIYPHSTIGYLGELFIVSFLRTLLPSIPGFDPSINWTSRLRKRARNCPSFEGLTAYEEPEVSDITFRDEEGHLSKWLHCLGYKPARSWVHKSLTYYIEVKTTIRDAPTPFVMSAGQVGHAERWSRITDNHSEQESVNCYLIFRVFHILEDCRNMCIYIDPYKLMQDGVLEKRSRQYSVVPGKSDVEETMIEGEEEAESETEDEQEGEVVSERGHVEYQEARKSQSELPPLTPRFKELYL
ncbi:MAG: hypothetical protein Q9209_002166 [Squamulea sp. 1 TL-2023]